MSGRKRRQNWIPCSITTVPSTQSCKFWHQHCWFLAWLLAGGCIPGGRGGMLVTGTRLAVLCGLQHQCLLLGSSQQGEVFSTKDHPLFPQLAACLRVSRCRRGGEGGPQRLPLSRSICSVLCAAAPSASADEHWPPLWPCIPLPPEPGTLGCNRCCKGSHGPGSRG